MSPISQRLHRPYIGCWLLPMPAGRNETYLIETPSFHNENGAKEALSFAAGQSATFKNSLKNGFMSL